MPQVETIDRARQLAERIADKLGWTEIRDASFVRAGIVYGDDQSSRGVGCIWLFSHTQSVVVYSRGEPGDNFGVAFELSGDYLKAYPAWFWQGERWTPEAHAFCRQIDAATDGMVTYGARNKGETAFLDWLRADPT